MKNLKWNLAALVLLSAVGESSYAMKSMMLEGGRVGNGGGLMVCRDSSTQAIKEAQLLDYYEARSQGTFKLELDTLTGTWQVRAQAIVDRLKTVTPMRRDIYTNWLSTFEKEAIFLKDVQFSTIPDTGSIGVKKGCAFEQGLVQQTPRFPNDKRYFINDELWNALNDSEKAGLVFHEFLYREAIGYGHEDSISVRHLNSYIVDQNFKNASEHEWIETLQYARYEMTDINAPELDIKVTFDSSKIWNAGAETDGILRPVLQNRFPVFLGACQSQGCNVYVPNVLHAESTPNYRFHPSVSLIKFRGFILSHLPNEGIIELTMSPSGHFQFLSKPYASNPNAASVAGNAFGLTSMKEGKKVFDAYVESMNFESDAGVFLKTLHFKKDGIEFFGSSKTKFFVGLSPELNLNDVFLSGTACREEECASTSIGGTEPHAYFEIKQGNISMDGELSSIAPMMLFDAGNKWIKGGMVLNLASPAVSYNCVAGGQFQNITCITKADDSGSSAITTLKFVLSTIVNLKGGRFEAAEQTADVYSNLVPKAVTLYDSAHLRDSTGVVHAFNKGDRVYFNEDGTVAIH